MLLIINISTLASMYEDVFYCIPRFIKILGITMIATVINLDLWSKYEIQIYNQLNNNNDRLWEYTHLSTIIKDTDNYFGEFIKGTDKYLLGLSVQKICFWDYRYKSRNTIRCTQAIQTTKINEHYTLLIHLIYFIHMHIETKV